MKWEYLQITFKTGDSLSEIGGIGLKGWELVSVVVYDGSQLFYFKRPAIEYTVSIVNPIISKPIKASDK